MWSFVGMQPAKTTMALLGKYVVENSKVKNCAMVSISDNEAYVNITRAFRDFVVPRGVNFVDETGVRSTDSDFSAVSTRIVAAKPDCVFLFTTAPIAANLAIQLKQAGLPSTKLIGQTGLSSPQLVQIGGAAVEGWSSTPTGHPEATRRLEKPLRPPTEAKTGKDADNWAALGYSYMQVVASAIKAAGPNPTRESVRDALAKTKDVPVVIGTGKYSYVNRIPTYGSTFLLVKDGKFVEAPQ